jgi:hypothetical protein
MCDSRPPGDILAGKRGESSGANYQTKYHNGWEAPVKMEGAMQEDLDIERLRADTAGCEQSIFFNNAGASLQPRAVVARVIEHLRLEEQK